MKGKLYRSKHSLITINLSGEGVDEIDIPDKAELNVVLGKDKRTITLIPWGEK